ncbi:MAG: carboxypeptidase regulatory-like domain-containing protein [Pyrinomonadaceae bacterium]|nr:carboxypeptidase regulatory-like domain-containing protein [Pyrinomonadaceae bacterium]MBP6212914.1 carboxypeptidase regulatory-like domain-containing protein [Pyrinomonadaceae bacterium]
MRTGKCAISPESVNRLKKTQTMKSGGSTANIEVRRRRRLGSVALSVASTLLLVSAFWVLSDADISDSPAGSLTGESAISHLKQTGTYDSLFEAVTAARYQVNEAETGASASNDANGFRMSFTETGLQLRATKKDRTWTSNWRLSSLGVGDDQTSVGDGYWRTEGNRADLVRAGQEVTEWFVNRRDGLEHGFTLAARPGSKNSSEGLRLVMAVDGDLQAHADEDGKALTLTDIAGYEVLRYEKLKVWDAEGKDLTARMRTEKKGEVWFEVEDKLAIYPITVDPTFIQRQTIGNPGQFTNIDDRFGWDVAISGTTAVVGAYQAYRDASTFTGVAYVFVLQGGVWTQQVRLFPGSNGINDEQYGESVAISGNTVAVGARHAKFDNSIGGQVHGAVYVYTRTGTAWAFQQRIMAADTAKGLTFGDAVDIEGDQLVVGASRLYPPLPPVQTPAAGIYSFVRVGNTWSQQQKLTCSNCLGFGDEVELEGTTLLAPSKNTVIGTSAGPGLVMAYTRLGSSWGAPQQLVPNDPSVNSCFGSSVSVSGDIAVIGADAARCNSTHLPGAAYVFTRDSGSWSQVQKLTASDGYDDDNFGRSVAIEGETIVVGAPGDEGPGSMVVGAAYVFTRGTAQWFETDQLNGASVPRSYFGMSVAIKGGIMFIGAPGQSTAPNGAVFTYDGGNVQTTMRRPNLGGLTQGSVNQGLNDVDSPLVFKTTPADLTAMPSVTKGLVADGVTPLLFELTVPTEAFPGGGELQYRVEAEIVNGGTLDGVPIGERLLALNSGSWTTDRDLSFTAAANTRYAYLSPVGSDQLHFDSGANELKVRLKFTNLATQLVAGEKVFYIRKPPIALIHGYNTDGEWGDIFQGVLSTSRPRTLLGQPDFIRTIKYGNLPVDTPATELQNTVLPFHQLVPLVWNEFDQMRSSIATGWAMTRHDVVAHSQGGILTRLLSSKNSNQFSPQPFRNPDNFNRGRFHRVVTIGSPHNGTRIVRYMLALQGRFQGTTTGRRSLGISGLVSNFLISNGTAQNKFDPAGPQIIHINQPGSGAPWAPDEAAKFHLVQTTVNYGLAPSFSAFSYSDYGLGLNNANGALVLPRGSDGVVDFDSMTATTPEAGQSPPSNSYRMPSNLLVSHAFVDPTGMSIDLGAGVDLFGGTAGQVQASEVAQHVIAALDQDPAIPAADRIFGPFRLPAPVPASVVVDIQNAAENVTPGILDAIGLIGSASRSGKTLLGTVTQTYQFNLPMGETLAGPVFWTAERYGVNGVSGQGVSFSTVAGHPGQISLNIDLDVPGDVAIYGTATAVSGKVFTGSPVLAYSVEPLASAYTLSSIDVKPSTGDYTVGSGVEPSLWASYTDVNNPGNPPLRLRRWIVPPELDVISSAPGVLDVSDKLAWEFIGVGTSTVSIAWRGQSAQASFTAFNGDLGPTASSVSISGRVTTAAGSGVANAIVTMADADGQTRNAITGAFGYYQFDDVPSGETVVVSVRSKRYTFAPQIVNVNDQLTDLDFTAQP